jgi:hypothetical protein
MGVLVGDLEMSPGGWECGTFCVYSLASFLSKS